MLFVVKFSFYFILYIQYYVLPISVNKDVCIHESRSVDKHE